MNEFDIKTLQEIFKDFNLNDCLSQASSDSEREVCEDIAKINKEWFESILATYTVKDNQKLFSIKTEETLDTGIFTCDQIYENVEGLIYGNSYTFYVCNKEDNSAVSDNSLEWSLYLSEDSKVKLLNNGKGSEIKISIEDPELLGKFLIVEVKSNGYTIPINMKGMFWIHYRFRHINFVRLAKDIVNRCLFPEGISQAGTSLCGPAAVAYLFAKYQWDQYGKFIIDIHHKGITTIKSTGYTIDLNSLGYDYLIEDFIPQLSFTKDYVINEESRIPVVDYLFLVVLKAYTNKMINVKPVHNPILNELAGITITSTEVEFMKNILGCKTITDDSFVEDDIYGFCNKIHSKIAKTTDKMASVAVFLVNHRAFTDETTFVERDSGYIVMGPTHWIVPEKIEVNLSNMETGEILVKAFTWGRLANIYLSTWLFSNGLHDYILADVKITKKTPTDFPVDNFSYSKTVCDELGLASVVTKGS